MDSFGLSVYVEWLSALQRAPKEKQNREWGGQVALLSLFCGSRLKRRELWESSRPWTNNFALPSPGTFQGPSFLGCLVSSPYQEYAPCIPPSWFLLTLLPIWQMLLIPFRESKSENLWSPFNTCSRPQSSMKTPSESEQGWEGKWHCFWFSMRASQSGEIAVIIAGTRNLSLYFSNIWQLLSTYYMYQARF